MIKNYILDTNICLSDAQNILRFEDNHVVLTGITIQEIEKKKSFGGEIGYQARECARILDDLRSQGNMAKGVTLPNGGTLTIYYTEPVNAAWLTENKMSGFDPGNPDIQIIAASKKYKKAHPKQKTILVTSDRFMRINAELAGVEVQDYKNEQVELSNYTGHRNIAVPQAYITSLYKTKTTTSLPDDGGIPFTENEFLTLQCGSLRALTVYRHGEIQVIPDQKIYNGFTPANKMQTYALWALNQEDIPMVILLGSAGCVDKDTEFFTGAGWKKISEWDINDKVLQFHPETGKASLVTPKAYIKLPCDEMYRIKTEDGIDQVLSADHTVVYYTYSELTKDFTQVNKAFAKDFAEKHAYPHEPWKIKTDFRYSGTEIKLSDKELQLMLAVICCGRFKEFAGSKRCLVTLNDRRKKFELEQLLKECGCEYERRDEQDDLSCFIFKAPRDEETFKPYWYQASQRQLHLICSNVLKWGGKIQERGRFFVSEDKAMADFIQFVFASCGWNASIEEIKIDPESEDIAYELWIADEPMLEISHDARKEQYPDTPLIKTVDGYKYCFNVPSHMLVLRRNGKIFITGNCAKTFLSLSVGLDNTYVDIRKRGGRYNRILISRPNAEAGDPSFGYLPGSLEEKMTPLLLPYTDNLETLLSGAGKEKESREQVQIQIEDLFESGVLEVCALSYIRGRSLNDVYIICDEFQNATRSLTRDVASRIGKGSKLVMAGDPTQCDAPHLDSRNNGLIFAKESMKGSPLCAIITFDSSNTVRSELAKTVVERMKL